jgi:phage tail protein X
MNSILQHLLSAVAHAQHACARTQQMVRAAIAAFLARMAIARAAA